MEMAGGQTRLARLLRARRQELLVALRPQSDNNNLFMDGVLRTGRILAIIPTRKADR